MATRSSPAKTTKTTAHTATMTAGDDRKARAVAALRALLAADLDALTTAARAAHDAATHPEAKPENDKDTRALEAGYLAGAQAARAAEVQRALAEFDRAAPATFALLTVREEQKGRDVDTVMLLSPWGGGQKCVVDDVTVTVVTPQSPLGAALRGRRGGDDVLVEMGARVRTLTVIDAH
jgi:transcription elongation GreA/GreB family factor